MNDILKTLTIKVFHINEVEIGNKLEIIDNSLTITNEIDLSKYKDIKQAKISLLKPYQRDVEVNSVLDIIPISTKVYGKLGEGVTNTLTGVYVLLTAKEESGQQFFNFGHCYGKLSQIVMQNKIGTFTEEDYLIHIDITSCNNPSDPRKTVANIHASADDFIQKIRTVLKQLDAKKCSESHTYHEKNNKNAKKVVMIKQVAGQGAMMDNLVLPNEPSGVEGAYSIIDLKNLPIIISPNEYRDGAIRSMT